ncbi:MAG: phosphoglucosamine mutase, partial [Tissierellia bacterium]|nr:phosphoglucosamine mutase [Tissierellia bacterium]
SNTIIIAKDTRHSGDLLLTALASGMMSMGVDVIDLGVLPTPAVAYLTKKHNYMAGVVISASHNPFEYNGIKFFNNEGFKLRDEIEEQIEEIILGEKIVEREVIKGDIGKLYTDDGLGREYEEYLLDLMDFDLTGIKIALDCGNGALYEIAPRVFKELNADVVAINTTPDGKNINDNSGSTNPGLIQELVLETGAAFGFSFDGDADRIIAVDDEGEIINGDSILAICASHLKKNGKLKNNGVVGTVMTNIGLDKYLDSIDAKIIKTAVGDRYVLEEMINNGYSIGGEQSGHIIFLDNNTTGDGLATALQLLEIALEEKKRSSELNTLMIHYPQILVNAVVQNELKYKYMEYDEIKNAVDAVEEKFDGNGRVVIRTSGTEPLVRVMIEGPDEELINKEANELAILIENVLG